MDRIRVLTINIWNRQGPWEKRLPLLREGIRALEPDLVGLQEVLHMEGAGPNQAEDIGAGLGYHVAFGRAWSIWNTLDLGNALLSRWPIVARQSWPLPVYEGADEGRSLLYALVDAPFGKVPVFVTHLSWRFHEAAQRALQVRAIDDRAAEVAPPATSWPAILMGDFNAEPDSDEIRFLKGLTALGGRSTYWADTFGLVGEGVGHSWSRRNAYALAEREPSRRIDYVFTRGPDRKKRGEPLAARVVLDEEKDGVWPSDHFGVLAEISV